MASRNKKLRSLRQNPHLLNVQKILARMAQTTTGCGTKTLMNKTDIKRMILDYEIRSSWWASWIGIGWIQTMAANYFAWKVNRKFARWKYFSSEQ